MNHDATPSANNPQRQTLQFDTRYKIDNTNIRVIYNDGHVSLHGDYYVMMFNDGYNALVKPLDGHRIKFLFDLGFDILKDTGNIVHIDKRFYAEKLGVDSQTIYHYIAELKRAGLLRKVKGVQKVYAINPKVLWRKTLKERQHAIEQWDRLVAQDDQDAQQLVERQEQCNQQASPSPTQNGREQIAGQQVRPDVTALDYTDDQSLPLNASLSIDLSQMILPQRKR